MKFSSIKCFLGFHDWFRMYRSAEQNKRYDGVPLQDAYAYITVWEAWKLGTTIGGRHITQTSTARQKNFIADIHRDKTCIHCKKVNLRFEKLLVSCEAKQAVRDRARVAELGRQNCIPIDTYVARICEAREAYGKPVTPLVTGKAQGKLSIAELGPGNISLSEKSK